MTCPTTTKATTTKATTTKVTSKKASGSTSFRPLPTVSPGSPGGWTIRMGISPPARNWPRPMTGIPGGCGKSMTTSLQRKSASVRKSSRLSRLRRLSPSRKFNPDLHFVPGQRVLVDRLLAPALAALPSLLSTFREWRDRQPGSPLATDRPTRWLFIGLAIIVVLGPLLVAFGPELSWDGDVYHLQITIIGQQLDQAFERPASA